MLIYLIDDDSISLFVAEQTLQMEEFAAQVLAFTSAEAALASLLPRLGAEVPDLVLLDLNMPMMSGWDFLEALNPFAEQLEGACAIYLLTSSLALVDVEKAKEHPLVNGIFHKPLDEDELKVVAQALHREKNA
jgi:CheY-like chemotaxis protein